MTLKKQSPLERGAGVLLPVSSLPAPYGIGNFGRAAYDFVDFLAAAGQRYWQVLPLGPTSYGDSPYASFSAFGGNPYFIDPDTLVEEGLLTAAEVAEPDWGTDPGQVDYAALYRLRFPLLHRAFGRWQGRDSQEYRDFARQNAPWLENYCLFMALKDRFGGSSWQEWPEELRLRSPRPLAQAASLLEEEQAFWGFCQFQFGRQWQRLKAYANARGVQIIGDIPIYVALDSADVWAMGEQFQLDRDRRPLRVAGVPPDLFSATGQLWGNPLYRWDAMEEDGFAWWKARMAHSARLYDIVRIDHFIGVVNYYSIPAGSPTAMEGEWLPGPGEKLLAAIGSVMGSRKIIAEDLGVVTPPVRRLLRKSGYPGMKILEFAFDSDGQNQNLPCHYDKNCVVYGGTHDNETLAGFFAHQPRRVLRFARDYLGLGRNRELPWGVVRAAYASAADIAVLQLQDLLGLDNHARINTPSTLGENWRWRLTPGQLPQALAPELRGLAGLYGRRPAGEYHHPTQEEHP